jgi:nitroreductase
MNETIQTLRSLRTIRGDFTEQRISEQDMETVLESAVRAANASGRQSYSIVIVSDKEKMRHLCGYAGDRLLVFCVDFMRIIDMAQHLGHDFTVPDIVGFVTGCTDTILAAQTACIAAKSLGIDSFFNNGIHRGAIERVFAALELPERYCFPLVALVLGYAGKEPPHQKGRLSGPGILHHGSYRRLTNEQRDELVAQYDDPARHLALNEDWAKEGVQHYLDWFYTKWSRRYDTQPFWKVLQKAGFVPHGRE